MWFPVNFVVRWFGWTSLFLLLAWLLDQMFGQNSLVIISGQGQIATFQVNATAMLVATFVALVMTVVSFGDDLKGLSKPSRTEPT